MEQTVLPVNRFVMQHVEDQRMVVFVVVQMGAVTMQQ